jgi:periplasmic protein TonB
LDYLICFKGGLFLNRRLVSPCEEPGLLSVTTMVLWCGCLAVGIAGIVLAAGHTKPAAPMPPVETELLNVETVSQRSAAQPAQPTAQSPAETPPPPALPVVASATFAQPMDQPIRAPASAAPSQSAAPTNKPAVIRLTYGVGEGQQPAPVEPPEAVLDGEEGTAVVRLTVGEDGRVTEAEAVSPSRWPLLNNAALRTIRSTWRFRRGTVRVYEVAIEFDINRQQ